MAKQTFVGLTLSLVLISSGRTLTSDFLLEPIKPQPRIDYALGFVFYENRIDSTLIALEDITTFDRYLSRQIQKAIKNLWQENTRQTMRQQAATSGSKGLIPEIGIPVKIPGFGEGSKIDIGGGDEITFGGRNTFMSGTIAQDPLNRPSFLPELKMQQKLRVNLDGTIGNRMHILIDHDSERETEAKNKIQLKYTGDPDDILQSVEMGDTQLNIPTTGYVGSLPTHKGLFGISAKTKLGGLDLYTIASREQGAGLTAQFTGTTQVSTDTIYDSDFLRKKFYYLPAPLGQIDQLWVYIDDRSQNQLEGKQRGIALHSPADPSDTSEFDRGYFLLKQPNVDYVFNPKQNILELNSSLNFGNALAVRYRLINDSVVGDTAYQDSLLLLQLIAPPYPDPQLPCWNLELKNVYYTGEQVTLSNVEIHRNDAGSGLKPKNENAGPNKTKTFARILGLDPNDDGIVEYPVFQRGYIMFPDTIQLNPSGWPDSVIYPFASAALSKPDPIIYQREQLQEGEGKGYFILAQSSQSKPTFDLGFDLTEGSERVIVNGAEQKKDADYSIDYNQGVITFLRPLPANADVSISYEHTPLFTQSQKSLLGTRAELTFLEKGKLGYSVFYRSEGVPGERPTLGSEPYKRVINEVDLSYGSDLPTLTRMIDRLPIVRTEIPSSFAINADAALSLPDPNSRGATYIDDFEGTSGGTSTGIAEEMRPDYFLWHHASVPVGKNSADFAKAPLAWFNPATQLKKIDIYGTAIGSEAKDYVPYLKIAFTPDNTASWAGIMTAVPTGFDLTDFENIEAVIKTQSNLGKLHISYGTYINEDAPRRNRTGAIVGLNHLQDTEDKNNSGQLDVNPALNEDTGLDTVAGTDGSNVAGDDGNDDWSGTDLNKINGTEKNNRLDNEDLDRNGFSERDDYYEVTVDLDSAQFFQPLNNGWRLLRVPIKDTSRINKVNNPKAAYTNLVRFWFDGFTAPDTIQLVSLNFTGSKWKNLGASPMPDRYVVPVDSTEKVEVASVSKKTDSTYTTPFVLTRDPVTGYLESEASLELKYTNLKQRHQAAIRRNTSQRDDYREYRQLKLYLHNDENDPVFFLRLGSDTVNFYEYHNTISAGKKVTYGDGNWYEFEISLDSLPLFKSKQLSSPLVSFQGNPSLAEVSYLSIGIENLTGSPFGPGAIWFDDIRLTGPRRELGAGLQTRVNLTLADLGAVNFSYQYTDPNFKSFNDPRGVKTGGFSHQVGFTSQFNLNKFLPAGLQFNIPFGYTLNRSQTTPKFSPYVNDLLLDKATANKELGTTNSENINLNVSKNRSPNKILNYSLDALSFNWLRSKTFNNASLNIDSSQNTAATLQYAITPTIKFKGFSLFPQTVGWSLGRSAVIGKSYSRFQRDSSFVNSRSELTNAATAGVNFHYDPYRFVGTTFGITQNRNLLKPNFVQGVNIGTEQGRTENSGASLQFPINTIITQPNLNYQATYIETQPLASESKGISNTGVATLRFGLDPFQLIRIITKPRSPKRDTGAAPATTRGLALAVDKFTRSIQPLNITATHSQASGYQGVSTRPGWQYQLGLADTIADTSSTNSLQKADKIDISTGANFGDLNFQASLNQTITNNSNWTTTTRTKSLTWPNLNIGFARLERFFKKLATTSSLSSGYSYTLQSSGVLGQTANQTTNSQVFSPLILWHTQWQRRIATDIKADLSTTETTIPGASITKGNELRNSFSILYAFSAPRGIKFPGLKNIHFTSDLNLQLTVAYIRSQSTLYYQTKITPSTYQTKIIPSRNDENIDTQLSATYNFSQSVEGGLRLGYTIYNNRLTNLKSRTPDINFSVKFIF
jgi:hypothetical protein